MRPSLSETSEDVGGDSRPGTGSATSSDRAELGPVPPADSGIRPRLFGSRQIAVIALLLLAGLVGTSWFVLRARPVAMATPVASPSVAASAPAGEGADTRPTSPPSSSVESMILVHVLGAVRKPGVVSLPATARVMDAIAAAGGLGPGADPADLNLAAALADGQQVAIGTTKKPLGTVRGGSGEAADGAAPAPVLDLNQASSAQLQTLPGVGPVTAGSIIAWRTEHQRFTRVEELQEVDGIGPKTYARIFALVRV